jgi:putative ABC transport system permease protein
VLAAWIFEVWFNIVAGFDTGFDSDHTLAVSFLDRGSQDLPPERKTAFQEQLRRDIQSVPGVISAASSTHVPLSGAIWSHFFRVGGVSDERKASRFAYVSPGYFATLKIPIRSGRDFDDLDIARSQRVMLVNESFARAHLGGRAPSGATIRTIEEPGFPEVTYHIIGIVGDTKYADLRAEDCWCGPSGGSMAPIAYVPIAQNPSPYAWASIIVRSSAPAASLTPAIARSVAGLNPAIATGFTDLKRQVRNRMQREELIAWIAGAFGILAMVLVTVGIYGIIAYLAVSRRHEIGIRLALGSTRAQIVRLVLQDNLWLIGTGLAIGLPVAIASMRGARALLFGLTPTNVPAVIGAAGLLTVVGVFAAAVPAMRAARARPDEALRGD